MYKTNCALKSKGFHFLYKTLQSKKKKNEAEVSVLTLFHHVHVTGVSGGNAQFSGQKCEICSDRVIKKKQQKDKHMLSEASHVDSCAVIKTPNVFLYISQ